MKFEVPDSSIMSVLISKELPPVPNESEAVTEAIRSPVGTDPLSKMAGNGSKVTLLVSDVTRPCSSHKILPPLLTELLCSGVKEENITIYFATGMHRGHTPEERRALVGQEITDKFRLVDHNSKDTDNLVSMGQTKRGTKVFINRAVMDCDVKIGVAGFDTVCQNHSMMLLPGAEAGRADGNPVREDMEEVARMAGLDFIVNAVLNDRREIVKVVAGDYVKAHREGVPPNDYVYKVPLPEKADIVIASAGGYPKDIDLYQAQRALDNAAFAVKDSGTILLLANCGEGLGDKTFETWLMEADSPDDVIRKLRENFVLGGHKAFAIARLAKRAEIVLVSILPETVAKKAFMSLAKSIEEALKKAFGRQGSASRIVLMSYAGSTLPQVNK